MDHWKIISENKANDSIVQQPNKTWRKPHIQDIYSRIGEGPTGRTETTAQME